MIREVARFRLWVFYLVWEVVEFEYMVHKVSFGVTAARDAENIRCGGNDLRLGVHAAEWNG